MNRSTTRSFIFTPQFFEILSRRLFLNLLHQCVSSTLSLVSVKSGRLEGTADTTLSSREVGVHTRETVERSWALLLLQIILMVQVLRAHVLVDLLLRINRMPEEKNKTNGVSQKDSSAGGWIFGVDYLLGDTLSHAANSRRFGLLQLAEHVSNWVTHGD
jgi:hypothetical protein